MNDILRNSFHQNFQVYGSMLIYIFYIFTFEKSTNFETKNPQNLRWKIRNTPVWGGVCVVQVQGAMLGAGPPWWPSAHNRQTPTDTYNPTRLIWPCRSGTFLKATTVYATAYSIEHWASHALQGTRNTRACITGHPAVKTTLKTNWSYLL